MGRAGLDGIMGGSGVSEGGGGFCGIYLGGLAAIGGLAVFGSINGIYEERRRQRSCPLEPWTSLVVGVRCKNTIW